MLPLPRRHAWLAGPPANTCSRNKPSKQTATTPPYKTKNPSCCRSRGGMRAWPVHRPTHAPATSPQNKRQQRPPQNQKPLVLPLPRRHAWLAAPVVKPSPPQTPSEQTATTPPHKTKKPSCCRSRACERIPLRHRSNLQRKKQHRHSGISAARRGLPPELRLRCREATAREGWRWRSFRGILSHPQERRHEEGAQSIFLNDFIRPGHSGLETCGRVAGLAIGTCAPSRRSVLLVSGKGGAGCNIGVSGRGSA